MDILEKLDVYIAELDSVKRMEIYVNEKDSLTKNLYRKIERAELNILKSIYVGK